LGKLTICPTILDSPKTGSFKPGTFERRRQFIKALRKLKNPTIKMWGIKQRSHRKVQPVKAKLVKSAFFDLIFYFSRPESMEPPVSKLVQPSGQVTSYARHFCTSRPQSADEFRVSSSIRKRLKYEYPQGPD
jgi:hypothetical protein